MNLYPYFVLLTWLINVLAIQSIDSVGLVSVTVAPPALETTTQTEKISKNCEELGFCEESLFYPEALAEFHSRKIEQPHVLLDTDDDVNTGVSLSRRSFSPIMANSCKYKETSITPVMVRYNSSWYYAVNVINSPVQKYYATLCVQNKSTQKNKKGCETITLKNGYTPKCVQKYATRRIVVLKDNDTITIPFRAPSCCTCVAFLDDK